MPRRNRPRRSTSARVPQPPPRAVNRSLITALVKMRREEPTHPRYGPHGAPPPHGGVSDRPPAT